ncbi:DeoR/GlpR family DNA-binding transcription regulator [Pseudonocardia sp. MH-G8]|uniref:DeoR/GlpR family DNA-binding transcription regulator n=1 Tax=Pseudonocardia sp. MH-G8 TaxID=1854588 RepID=UPI001303F89D|nr:DeoR/GlpR family DNA-binding transcription regulator [Pseudonocardia sp. MH-G8]
MAGIAEHERQQQVLRLLDVDGRVSVADLVHRFGVTAVTIRKDLEVLERRQLLARVRGGAVSADGADEGAFEMRLRHGTQAKAAIARAAAALVPDGAAIALDCSTTCYHLAQELRGRRNLIVVTNGLRAAELLSDSGVTVVLPGGTLRRSSWSVVGDFGDFVGSRGRLAMGFFGVRGLSREHGLMELTVEETTVKRRLAAACNEVYALFDSSKVGRFALHSFAPSQRITALYTDEGADPDALAGFAEVGVAVHRVPVAHAHTTTGTSA